MYVLSKVKQVVGFYFTSIPGVGRVSTRANDIQYTLLATIDDSLLACVALKYMFYVFIFPRHPCRATRMVTRMEVE